MVSWRRFDDCPGSRCRRKRRRCAETPDQRRQRGSPPRIVQRPGGCTSRATKCAHGTGDCALRAEAVRSADPWHECGRRGEFEDSPHLAGTDRGTTAHVVSSEATVGRASSPRDEPRNRQFRGAWGPMPNKPGGSQDPDLAPQERQPKTHRLGFRAWSATSGARSSSGPDCPSTLSGFGQAGGGQARTPPAFYCLRKGVATVRNLLKPLEKDLATAKRVVVDRAWTGPYFRRDGRPKQRARRALPCPGRAVRR